MNQLQETFDPASVGTETPPVASMPAERDSTLTGVVDKSRDAAGGDYSVFINAKTHLAGQYGFDPVFMPKQLFDFQRHLVEWSVRKGRCANFADCGLGKTPMQLTVAQNVHQKTGGRVLIATPLAVGAQTIRESSKFGIYAQRSKDGRLPDAPIVVTNYERLHYFNPNDFEGMVCDESAILKNVDGKIKAQVTDFMRKMRYRFLFTATAAPNDFIELGTSSEALGELGYMDMLSRFFKKSDATTSRKDENRSGLYRFRGHAERDFWRWVCSWSRSVRKPSDLGFPDNGFELPDLVTRQHVVEARTKNPEFLFDMPAFGLAEQRKERSRTVYERCEMAANIANGTTDPVVSWCYLNKEGDLLQKMIDGSEQVSGNDSDDRKEELFDAFTSGQLKKLVTKPLIAASGMNWQHCNRMTFFPSHSFEQWYQSIRRFWRFGQTKPVYADVITSEGELNVLSNLQRKADAADRMFENLVRLMNDELAIQKNEYNATKTEIPSWLQ